MCEEVLRLKLTKALYEHIAEGFGKNEADDPCYSYEGLVDAIVDTLKEERIQQE